MRRIFKISFLSIAVIFFSSLFIKTSIKSIKVQSLIFKSFLLLIIDLWSKVGIGELQKAFGRMFKRKQRNSLPLMIQNILLKDNNYNNYNNTVGDTNAPFKEMYL